MARALLSILLGILTLLVGTAVLLTRSPPLDRHWLLHVDAGRVWTISARSDVGRTWHCADRYTHDLLTGPLDAPAALPTWAVPVADEAGPPHRVATLAIGWPARWLTARWIDRTGATGFPPAAVYDEDEQAMRQALTALRSPSGWSRVELRPGAAALDVAVPALGWWVALTLGGAWRRRLSRRESAEPRPGRG